MNINYDNNVPIYLQLVEYIKVLIISEKLKSGDKLLSVREFALKYKVNPNTMQKALMTLEDEGLIFTERTNGKYVTNNKELIKKVKDKYASNLAKKYFNDMKNIGYSKEESIKYLGGIK